MLHIVKHIKRPTALQGPMILPPQCPPDLVPCHARKKIAVSTDPSSGSRRRRNRTKRKKSRASAAKRAARRVDAATLLEGGRERVTLEEVVLNKNIKHVESVAEEEEAPPPYQVPEDEQREVGSFCIFLCWGRLISVVFVWRAGGWAAE